MFTPSPHPANGGALPWTDRPDTASRERIGGVHLDATAVGHFDRLLHDIHPGAPHVDADRIATMGRWLQQLPPDHAHAVLDERLSRIERMRTMLDDPDWDCRDTACLRVRKLLAYLDQDRDLIPDAIPMLGLLDDVILLELAWPAVATEAEDYLDFCRYRSTEQPRGEAEERRKAWVRDRLLALALFQQHARVRAHRYAEVGGPARPFRVS